LLVHHPSSSRGTTHNSIFHNEDPMSSLSHIPWTFQQSIQIASEKPTSSTLSEYFPAFSYLDLRRHQNRAWANDRLLKGNEQYYLNPEQADKLYQEGIDLVPDHIDLLVAQAKLWLMRRSRLDAARLQLKNALQLDATHGDAKHWMNRLERHEAAIAAARRGDVGANHQAQTRNSTAYQNVLMERNLLMASQHSDEEPSSSDTSSSSPRRRSKRHKKTKQKKKARKHKKESKNKGRKRRRRYDSSSASDESSNDASIGSGRMGCDGNKEEEKGDVPTSPRKRRRRKRYFSDASSTLGDDDSGVKSSRNRGRKEPDRQSDDSLGDHDSRSHRRHKKRSRSHREKTKHRKKHHKSETRSDSPRESNSG